jgi:NHLM bacteriocin system ABC transporter peptidase/ATP-binding protein
MAATAPAVGAPPASAPPAPSKAPHAAPSRRVRTPTIIQMEAVECGAAALRIVLAYYGRYVPAEELRVECGVSRDGSKASNVVRAARRYGLNAKGLKREPDKLGDLALPFIVFWNFNHFVVVEGFKPGKVFLNDPATGPRVVTAEEFDQSFTGVILAIEKGPEFKPGGDNPGILSALASRLPGTAPSIGYLLLAGLALVIPGLVVPVFSKVFVDEILVKHFDSWVKPLLLGMSVTMVLMAGLTWLQSHFLSRFHAALSLTTGARFFWHVLHLPVGFYSQRSAGEISSRVQINDKVAGLLAGEVARALLHVAVVVFYAALMLFYDWFLTLIGLAVAIANIVFLKAIARRRIDATQRLAIDNGKLFGTSMNGLRLVETLKASGMESDFFRKWAGYQSKVMTGQQVVGSQELALQSVPPLLSMLNGVAILAFGGLRVMDGHLTMGMLVAFQALMAAFINPINQLVGLAGRIQEMHGDMNRLDDVLNYPVDRYADPRAGTASLDAAERPVKLKGGVELRGVTFGYSRLANPLIENFSLKLKPGSRVALIGPSGCGKSTVSKLVMGLYEPWAGEILFDGAPRAAVPRLVMSNSVSMVDQDITLFQGTIRDNLTMWDETLAEAAVVRAAKDAEIHDVIAARPGGYEAQVSEMGANFSGGQRQRLEIARALAVDPVVVVLDEATSALDPTTEARIDDNLRRRGCTCLIIAHRLSTIRDCDEIIVLDRGKVVQRGTHDELLRDAEGLYAQLIRNQ